MGSRGGYTVLNMDNNCDFDLIDYLSQFKWFEKETFFDFNNFMEKKYLMSKGILTKAEDKDSSGTPGMHFTDDNMRVAILFSGDAEKLEDIKKNLPEEYFEFI